MDAAGDYFRNFSDLIFLASRSSRIQTGSLGAASPRAAGPVWCWFFDSPRPQAGARRGYASEAPNSFVWTILPISPLSPLFYEGFFAKFMIQRIIGGGGHPSTLTTRPIVGTNVQKLETAEWTSPLNGPTLAQSPS